MAALSTRTTLVTITVGGNDNGFTNTATVCLTGSDADCESLTLLAAHTARTVISDKLTALYRDVKANAPAAKIIVLGYPDVLDEGTGSCGAITPNAFRRHQMAHNANHLAEGIRHAAARAGVTFVDVRTAFEGHEACTPDPYINGVDANHLSEIFHPTNYGHRVVYTFMLQYETDMR